MAPAGDTTEVITDRAAIKARIQFLLRPEMRRRMDQEKLLRAVAKGGPDAEFLEEFLTGPRAILENVMIQCADGLTMSLQTGAHMYCKPRDSIGPWTAVEIGFPSRELDQLWDHPLGLIEAFLIASGSSEDEPTMKVYAYVPMKLLVDIIIAAGGLRTQDTSA